MKLVIDGWTLQRDDVGLGVYSRRLIDALSTAADRPSTLVLLPNDEIVTPAGIERLVLKLPAIANETLREFAWQQFVALTLRLRFRDSAFHSPSECWLIVRPRICVVTCHDCIPVVFACYTGRNPLRRALFSLRQKFLRQASLVLTVSEHARNEIIHHYRVSKARVRVLSNCVSDDFRVDHAETTAPLVREKYGLPSEYWLYIGGFDTRKNIPFLLDAYKSLRDRGISLPKLVLAGRQPRLGQVNSFDLSDQINAKSLVNSIVLPGRIDREDLPGLYGGANLFVYPSLLEGFGLPPLEAMACGCPTLVADNSSLPEVVGDSDYRFPTGDTGRLEELLHNAALKPLRMNPGFDRHAFSSPQFAAGYLDIIRTLLPD